MMSSHLPVAFLHVLHQETPPGVGAALDESNNFCPGHSQPIVIRTVVRLGDEYVEMSVARAVREFHRDLSTLVSKFAEYIRSFPEVDQIYVYVSNTLIELTSDNQWVASVTVQPVGVTVKGKTALDRVSRTVGYHEPIDLESLQFPSPTSPAPNGWSRIQSLFSNMSIVNVEQSAYHQLLHTLDHHLNNKARWPYSNVLDLFCPPKQLGRLSPEHYTPLVAKVLGRLVDKDHVIVFDSFPSSDQWKVGSIQIEANGYTALGKPACTEIVTDLSRWANPRNGDWVPLDQEQLEVEDDDDGDGLSHYAFCFVRKQ